MAFTASTWGQGQLLTGLSPGSSLSGFTAVITKANLPTSALDTGPLSGLNGGGDFYFATDINGANQLPAQIVTCVTNATAGNTEFVAWVRFPTYASGTRSVYAFWNKAGQSQPLVGAAFGRNAVWVDYEAVVHMNEVGTNGVFEDSTGNGHGTTLVKGASLPTVTTQNPFGGSWPDFNQTQYLQLNNSIGLVDTSPNGFNISIWMNADASSTSNGVFGNWSRSNNNIDVLHFTSSGRFFAKVSGATGVGGLLDYSPANTVGVSYLISVSGDSSGATAYVNGVGQPINTQSMTGMVSGEEFTIGSYYSLANSLSLNGRAAEARIARQASTPNKESSEHSNQNNPSTFWTAGAVFVPGGGGGGFQSAWAVGSNVVLQ
jgi:hypothetical protein